MLNEISGGQSYPVEGVVEQVELDLTLFELAQPERLLRLHVVRRPRPPPRGRLGAEPLLLLPELVGHRVEPAAGIGLALRNLSPKSHSIGERYIGNHRKY